MAERKAFLLRIDPELWAELESWAQAELRSVNGQIEYVLREAVQRRTGRTMGQARSRPKPPPHPPPAPPTESGERVIPPG